MKKYLLFLYFVICYLMGYSQEIGAYKDSRDGKVYKTVKIGTQTWMAENLTYKPKNGNYWAYENVPKNVDRYGYLYDWETAKAIAPKGWHLPTDAEWAMLIAYLGGKIKAGDKMKEIGCWTKRANNESGFTALPGGNRSAKGTFGGIGNNGFWWSATEDDSNGAWCLCLFRNVWRAERATFNKTKGYSVRYVKD